LENLFGFVFTKLVVYFGEEINDFPLRFGRFFPPQKLKLISRGFELFSQLK